MVIQCPECGQKNRIPAARVDQVAKCGQCGADLRATGEPVAVGPKSFRDLVDHSPLPVVVDFWAPWCGPCRMAAPEVAKLAERHAGEVVVVKVNTEDHPDIAQQEGVRGIPMFALYQNGERKATQTGLMKADQLARALGL